MYALFSKCWRPYSMKRVLKKHVHLQDKCTSIHGDYVKNDFDCILLLVTKSLFHFHLCKSAVFQSRVHFQNKIKVTWCEIWTVGRVIERFVEKYARSFSKFSLAWCWYTVAFFENWRQVLVPSMCTKISKVMWRPIHMTLASTFYEKDVGTLVYLHGKCISMHDKTMSEKCLLFYLTPGYKNIF